MLYMDATEERDGRQKAKLLKAIDEVEKKMAQKRPKEMVLVPKHKYLLEVLVQRS